MNAEISKRNDRADPVNRPCYADAANERGQGCRPFHVGEFEHHAGDGQTEEADNDGDMQNSFAQAKSYKLTRFIVSMQSFFLP